MRPPPHPVNFPRIQHAPTWHYAVFTCASTAIHHCSPEGFRGTSAAVGGSECLKLKQGAAKWAAFLETRRYASYLGATTEFSKWEGATYDASRNVMYVALTANDVGMLPGALTLGSAVCTHMLMMFRDCTLIALLRMPLRLSSGA